jgi:CHAD domain-containing protein
MSFRFKRKESVQQGIRRLGANRLAKARKCLDDDRHQAEAIHCARKVIKEARAVLRLARAGIRGKSYRRIKRGLKAAAARLAPARDAFVTAATFDHLKRYAGQPLPAGVAHPLKQTLQSRLKHEQRRFESRRTARVVRQKLRAVEKVWRKLEVKQRGWALLERGLRSTYEQGRMAFLAVAHGASEHQVHLCRKRAKDLWSHLRLLRLAWPKAMVAAVGNFETLADRLGDDHDLSVLQQVITDRKANGKNAGLATVARAIGRRHVHLRQAILRLGKRVFAEAPAGFCERLADHWRRWRR